MRTTSVIQDPRITRLNEEPAAAGDFVLYWMQQSQRASRNHALEYAVQRANDLGIPLLACFGLTSSYPEASERHYRFMLEGLAETSRNLERRGIRLVARLGEPDEVALEIGRKAALVVCDRGYLRHQRMWRSAVAAGAGREVVEVESDLIVPVEAASDKAETAARTIRPKINRALEEYLVDLRATPLDNDSLSMRIKGEDAADTDGLLEKLSPDRSVPAVDIFHGGAAEGKRLLNDFLGRSAASYVENRNRPETDDVSHMSKYLHFGQISPMYIALKVQDAKGPSDEFRRSYLEELIVRRGLAFNFVWHNDAYDRFDCLPGWARKTLEEHAGDDRPHLYSARRLEEADTHDRYWNAAMLEMKHTGYMHNYMRMYWGKKMLEWSASPRQAFRTALALNNRYFIDGRDPNSYAGVAWVFGMHDRAWGERKIFGKVRYMSSGGLERKADPEAYVEKVERLVRRAGRED